MYSLGKPNYRIVFVLLNYIHQKKLLQLVRKQEKVGIGNKGYERHTDACDHDDRGFSFFHDRELM